MVRNLCMGIVAVLTLALLAGCNPQQSPSASVSKKSSSEVTAEPQEIFANNCASCHGEQLQGNIGPNLQKIGAKYSKEQIAILIKNGKGNMPSFSQLPDQTRDKLAAWLAEKK